MFDPQPVKVFVAELIHERDKVLEALLSDRQHRGTQQKLADWKAGCRVLAQGQQTLEFGKRVHLATAPPGKTTRLLEKLRRRYEFGAAQMTFQQAKTSVTRAGLDYLLAGLDTAFKAHTALLDDARNAYEQSRLVDIQAHRIAIKALSDGLQSFYKPRDKRAKQEVWRAQAIDLVLAHPDWTDKRIAREVGIHPSDLSKDRKYQRMAAAVRAEGKP